MQPQGPERPSHQLVIAGLGLLHAHGDDQVARTDAQPLHGAEPDQVLELVLQPGPADGERLAGGPAGAHLEQRGGVVALRQEITGALTAQLGLVDEGNDLEVADPADMPGMQPVAVEQAAVERHRLVRMAHQPAEPRVLPEPELGAGGAPMAPHGRQRRRDLGAAGGHARAPTPSGSTTRSLARGPWASRSTYSTS